MRKILIVAVAGLALGGCFKKQPPAAAASNSAPFAMTNAAPAAGDDSQLTPQQLEAKAQALEAEAQRLQNQANGQAQPPQANAQPPQDNGGGGGGMSGAGRLWANSEKLATGEPYNALSFTATAGHTYEVTYQAQGYTPQIIVLDTDRKPFTQSTAMNGSTVVHDEIQPDKPGTWYVLLSAVGAGATGTYRVNIQELTSTSLMH